MIRAHEKDRMMHRFVAILSLVALALVSTPVLAQEHGESAPHGPEWVQQKVKVCASCHGQHGVSTVPTFPIIAGQYESYLFHALQAYRDGERQNPIMAAQVGSMTNAQLHALAAYFSQQETPLYTPTMER